MLASSVETRITMLEQSIFFLKLFDLKKGIPTINKTKQVTSLTQSK